MFHRGVSDGVAAKIPAKQPTSKYMDQLCAALTEFLQDIFQVRPPKQADWDDARGK